MHSNFSLSRLSTELIENILSFLSLSDLLVCSRLSRHIHAVIEGSVRLQYLIALETSGHISRHDLSTSDQLRELLEHECAWNSTPVRVVLKSTHVYPGTPQTVYTVSNHVFVYTIGRPPVSVKKFVRADQAGGKAEWRALNMGPDAEFKIILGIAGSLDIDLLAVLTFDVRELQATEESHAMEMRLFSLSSCEPHPDAPLPVVKLKPPAGFNVRSLQRGLSLSPLTASGDKIVFNLQNNTFTEELVWRDEVSVHCLLWRQGRLVMLRTETRVALGTPCAAFVDHDLLLFLRPSRDEMRLEICRLVPDPIRVLTMQTLLYLKLPKPHHTVQIQFARIHFEMPPTRLQETPPTSLPTFMVDPQFAMIKLQLMIEGMTARGVVSTDVFTCAISRKTIMEHADAAATKVSGTGFNRPFVSELCWTVAGSEDTHSPPNDTDNELFDSIAQQAESLNWEQWRGKAATRWFGEQGRSGRAWRRNWGCSFGQRMIAYDGGEERTQILDFNPYRINKAKAARGLAGDNSLEICDGPTALQLPQLQQMYWGSDAVSAMPYVATEIQGLGEGVQEISVVGREIVCARLVGPEMVVDVLEVCSPVLE